MARTDKRIVSGLLNWGPVELTVTRTLSSSEAAALHGLLGLANDRPCKFHDHHLPAGSVILTVVECLPPDADGTVEIALTFRRCDNVAARWPGNQADFSAWLPPSPLP